MTETVTLGALLQDYEAQEFTLLPPGEYECEIVHVKPRDTDVMPTLRVLSGPYAGKRTMIGVISAQGNAAVPFFQRMAELGIDKAWFQQFGEHLPIAETMKQIASALVGRDAIFEINQEPFKNEQRNKLVRVSRLLSVPAVPGAAGNTAT